MRKNHPLLKSAYIVTDAPKKWVDELKKWLLSEGWEKVWLGKKDLWGGSAEREMGQMIELEMARRAGVYVGNGVSLIQCARADPSFPHFPAMWC